MTTANDIAKRLCARPSGDGWIARCPAHDDKTPSLSISEGTDGKLLLYCHAGCSFEEVRRSLDLETPPTKTRPRLVSKFQYHDADGRLIYEKERWEPGFDRGRKSFVFRHNGRKGRGSLPVLYNLPAIAKAGTVFITEGEAKADLLSSWGLTATCLDSGAKSPWRESYFEALFGKDIVILPDNDEPGRGYAERMIQALHGKAKGLRVVLLPGLPEKGDVLDWARTKGNDKERLLNLVEAATEAETKMEEAAAPFGAKAPIAVWLDTEPPPINYLFEDLIISGMVGGIFAQGGVGKTYLILCLMLSAALGRPFFRTFRPTRSMRVLGLLGEDPPEMIHRRVKSMLGEFEEVDKALLSDNFMLYCGRPVPLMKLDSNNPAKTKAFEWLLAEVEAFRPELVIIDPKSMFYGLDENSNDNNTQWVNTLKDLAMNGATVLFSHHVTKAMSGTLELNGARGGSALVDGSRFAANMRRLTDEDAKRYDIDEPWRYVEFKVTKNSYVPRLPGSIFFKFTGGGALEEVDLQAGRDFVMVEELLSALSTEAANGIFYTAREVERQKTMLPDATARERKRAVQSAIATGRLGIDTQRSGRITKKILVITGDGEADVKDAQAKAAESDEN